MTAYHLLTDPQRQAEYALVKKAYEDCLQQKLKLNMARGKPCPQQLDMVSDILNVVVTPEDCIDNGVESRNYGDVLGMPSARAYFADLLGCRKEQVIVGGGSSLNLMYDMISRAYTHGLLHSPKPWCREEQVKFLCPCPGYDRHFRVTEFFGAQLITVPMLPTGPDMDRVEELVKDPQVKGVWCVPKYSNPDGYIYSDETVERFAALKPAAPDFTIMWDNAYGVHEFSGDWVPFPDIIEACNRHGNPDMVVEFASTSKITFAGGGISAMAMSEANVAYISKLLSVQTICYDKVNQLRHVRYLKDMQGLAAHMEKHRAILAPKFEMILNKFGAAFGENSEIRWTKPKGGYFISLFTPKGCAARTVELCAKAGVTLTPAGAAFPYGKDPDDSHIRIAPSYPTLSELETAVELLCLAVKLAAVEKSLAEA